jgi:MFS transporter, DHA3 family, macrolide efflux protein
VVSLLGSSLTGFGLGIWVYQETGSVTRLALVMLAVTVPGVLLAPIAGVYVDQLDRRVVMFAMDAIAGASTLVLALLFLTDTLAFWHILAATAVTSAAQAFQEPAYLAAIPTLVGKEQLGRANGLVQLGPAFGTLVAPLAAGALLATSGVWAILIADVVTFTVALVTLAIVRFPPIPRSLDSGESVPMRVQAWSGLRYLRARPGMWRLLLVFAGMNLLFGFVSVLYPPLFLSFTSELVLGAVLSVAGLGMVAGSLLMSAWGGPRRRVAGLMVMLGAIGIAIVLTGWRPMVPLAALGTLGVMFILPMATCTSQTLWQLKIPLDMQGRVFSTRRMLSVAATPIAYLLAGPLADRIFEPAMTDGGPLADIFGPIIGTGAGRGIGLMFILVGLATVALAASTWLDPKIRNLETDYPDIDMPAIDLSAEDLGTR